MPGWKRFREKTSQKMGLNAASFKPTTNERNEKMMAEASKFAARLKQCKGHVEALKKATAGMLNSTQAALTTPLPNVYERDPHTGQTTPVPRPEIEGGTGQYAQSLSAISQSTSKKMDGEVIKPMALWLKNYANIKKMMTYAENLRLDLDAERRSFNTLERKKVRHSHSKDPNAEESVKYATQGASIDRKLTHREARLNGTRDAWMKYEATVFDKLSALVKDAGSLREFLAVVLNIEEDAFSEAASVAHAVNTGTPIVRSLAATPATSQPATPTGRSEHTSPLGSVREEQHHHTHSGAPDRTSDVVTPEKASPLHVPAHKGEETGQLPPALNPEDSALDDFPAVPTNKIQPSMHTIHANHHQNGGAQPIAV